MSIKQNTMLMYLLVDLALVMDRVYFSHKTDTVNFRASWKWDVEHERPYYTAYTVQRLAITTDGTIVDRNTDARFV